MRVRAWAMILLGIGGVCWLASVAEAQWEPAVQLSPAEGTATLNENMGRCILADGARLHVVWAEKRNDDQAIYYRRSDDAGLHWQEEVRVSGASGPDSFPLLAQANGVLHLVFQRNNGTADAASFYRRSTDGGKSWEAEVPLGKSTFWPGVAAAGDMVYVSLNTVMADEPKNSVVYLRRSRDKGLTWEAARQISTAPRRALGRSEDPAIMASGQFVRLVWNDNRDAPGSRPLLVYSRSSSDQGATWGQERALAHGPDTTYFPTLSLSGADAYVAYGVLQARRYHVFLRHSKDFGVTWQDEQQLSNGETGDLYPALAADRANVHIVWASKGGLMYRSSADGGGHWDAPVCLAVDGMCPFIDVAGATVHVLFVSRRNGHAVVSYLRNPTGNKVVADGRGEDNH